MARRPSPTSHTITHQQHRGCPSSQGQGLGTSPKNQPALTLLTQHLGAEDLMQPDLRQNQV